MDGISLTDLADELLDSAREGSSGRAARTIHGGHDRVLRETVIAILAEPRGPASRSRKGCGGACGSTPSRTAGRGRRATTRSSRGAGTP